METIGITAFRRSLKHYLEEASASGNTIYQVGAGTDVLLLSPAALEHLQQRHFVNRWVRGRLSALKLDQYPTLSGGKDTKALSLEHLLALNALFQLATEVLDVLSHTGAKQNAMRWDISEYTKPKTVPKHGRFDTVHTVIRTCLEPWTMAGNGKPCMNFSTSFGRSRNWTGPAAGVRKGTKTMSHAIPYGRGKYPL